MLSWIVGKSFQEEMGNDEGQEGLAAANDDSHHRLPTDSPSSTYTEPSISPPDSPSSSARSGPSPSDSRRSQSPQEDMPYITVGGFNMVAPFVAGIMQAIHASKMDRNDLKAKVVALHDALAKLASDSWGSQ
ncbi:hypothetical protein MMC13_006645 [Lambiella insularis]|nr:hypothetical protein [Lambiella insularis]